MLEPFVATAVEVDPETPIPTAPFRLLAVGLRSLLGLPLRTAPIGPVDRIQSALRVPVPCIRHPVAVTRLVCAETTASDRTSAAHVPTAIHLCMTPPPRTRLLASLGDAAMPEPDQRAARIFAVVISWPLWRVECSAA